MEIEICVKYDVMNYDLARRSDDVFRDLHKRFPEAIWEKKGLGFKVTTLD